MNEVFNSVGKYCTRLRHVMTIKSLRALNVSCPVAHTRATVFHDDLLLSDSSDHVRSDYNYVEHMIMFSLPGTCVCATVLV